MARLPAMGHLNAARGITAALAVTAALSVTAAGHATPVRHRAVQFHPEGVSAVSPTDWWVVGKHGVAHTTDGGAHFAVTPVSARHVAGRGEAQIHFATAVDGYLYGRHLMVTHDGGQAFYRLRIGGHVSSVVSADGYAFATVGGRRHSVIKRSVVGTDTWTTVRTPGRHPSVEWADASHLFAVTHVEQRRNEGDQRLLVSRDDGSTWRRHHLPIEDLACEVQQVRSPVLWEHCATGMMSAVWRSRDNGRTFAAPQRHEGQDAEPNAAAFAAASNRVAVTGFQDLRRTTNAGRTWHEVGPRPRRDAWWDSITFSDRAHGFAVRLTPRRSHLWRTTDGGAHWHRVGLPHR